MSHVKAVGQAAALTLLTAGLAAAPALARKPPSPKAAASPNSSLTNNEEVTVSGTGFVPGSQVFVTECTKKIKGKKGNAGEPYCNIYKFLPLTITEQGTIPSGTTFTVFTGEVGSNGSTCGTSKKDSICYIGIGNAEGSSNDSALAKITFVP
jgi:hypothetical protein